MNTINKHEHHACNQHYDVTKVSREEALRDDCMLYSVFYPNQPVSMEVKAVTTCSQDIEY